MTDLVLASTSASRAAMLAAAGVAFEAVAPGVDEEALTAALAEQGAAPREVADALAEVKAVKVSRRYPGRVVLGGDQVLALDDGTRLEKPLTREGLKAQLLALKGRRHRLFSAAVLARDGAPLWRQVEVATLHVRDFSDAWAEAYVARSPDGVLQSVGGYHVEGLGVQLFDRIDGDVFTVRGLPLVPVLRQLRLLGVMAA
jgi:septum formation protein